MAVNYILNFIFIGYAAMRLGNIAFHKMALDLVFLLFAASLQIILVRLSHAASLAVMDLEVLGHSLLQVLHCRVLRLLF